MENVKMVSIDMFLKTKGKTVFIDKNSDIEYTKDELDADFQFHQDQGWVTIQEYYDNLKDFLNEFKIKSSKRKQQSRQIVK